MRQIRVLLVCLLIFTIGCAQEDVQETIQIGVVGPLSGPIEFLMEYMRVGFETARDEINAAGGINGRQIEFIYEDTKATDLDFALTSMKKLHEVNEVVAILGPYAGGPNVIANHYSKSDNVFFVSPGDNFGKVSPYKFHTRHLLEEESKILAEYAASQGYEAAAILYFNNDWGNSYLDTFTTQFENLGGKIVATENYLYDNLDVRTQLLKIRQASPDVLFIIDATTGQLFTQVRESGFDIALISEWQLQLADIEKYDDILDDVVFALPQIANEDIRKKLEERNGYANLVSVDSYSAVYLLADALQACPDYLVDCMSNYIQSLESFDNVTWEFEKEFVLHTVRDGQIVPLE